MDLWVGYEKREPGSSTDNDSESTDGGESLSWVAEDSEGSDEDVKYACAEHDEFRDSDIEDEDWEDSYAEDEDVDQEDVD
jgi:hypothetical protein